MDFFQEENTKSMSLVVVGVSHKTAPIELRERLALPPSQLGETLARLTEKGHVREAVILSTCNRFEIYARPSEESTVPMNDYFFDLYKNPNLKNSIYRYESEEAVRHLFRVAAGLDSLVVGETEVLGQVKSAYQFAHERGATGKITNVLFQRALFVGKAVRGRTTISEGSSSVGAVAVQLAERIFGALNQRRVLLLGAGEIAEVTARHLISQKAGSLVILNRTREKAEQLASLLNGQAGPLSELESELEKADIVICSATVDKPLVTREMVERLERSRSMKSLYFVDIAVPRNVEAGVHEIDNVYVYNIDDLQAIVQENMSQRHHEINAATSLVETMAQEFVEWLKAAEEGAFRPFRHRVDHAG